jgi:hypothetical protein
MLVVQASPPFGVPEAHHPGDLTSVRASSDTDEADFECDPEHNCCTGHQCPSAQTDASISLMLEALLLREWSTILHLGSHEPALTTHRPIASRVHIPQNNARKPRAGPSPQVNDPLCMEGLSLGA